jgi:hypothetical protein
MSGLATSGPAVGDRVVDGEYRALPDPVSDRIFDVLMCLAAEVWTVRDRLRLAEAALAEHGIDLAAAIDAVRDQPDALAAMTTERDAFVARILRPLQVQPNPSR